MCALRISDLCSLSKWKQAARGQANFSNFKSGRVDIGRRRCCDVKHWQIRTQRRLWSRFVLLLKGSRCARVLGGRFLLMHVCMRSFFEQTKNSPEAAERASPSGAAASPQSSGFGCYSFASDWWSFGVLLYQMLSGVCPFRNAGLVYLAGLDPKKVRGATRLGCATHGLHPDAPFFTLALAKCLM